MLHVGSIGNTHIFFGLIRYGKNDQYNTAFEEDTQTKH